MFIRQVHSYLYVPLNYQYFSLQSNASMKASISADTLLFRKEITNRIIKREMRSKWTEKNVQNAFNIIKKSKKTDRSAEKRVKSEIKRTTAGSRVEILFCTRIGRFCFFRFQRNESHASCVCRLHSDARFFGRSLLSTYCSGFDVGAVVTHTSAYSPTWAHTYTIRTHRHDNHVREMCINLVLIAFAKK